MPAAPLVRVVALSSRTCTGAEVVVVRLGTLWTVILVVADAWPGTRLVTSPGRAVAVSELGVGAFGIGVVSERVDRPTYVVEQLGGSLVTWYIASGYVPAPTSTGSPAART